MKTTHDERGFEIMYEGDDGWSDWVHPEPGYRMACCDCGLVHDMEFQLVRQDQIDGMSDKHRQPGETKQKAILYRARRVSEPAAPKPVD